jgi:hypothetical protein
VGPLILAWALGEGIIVWRSAVKDHQPPVPGQLLAATGLFALLALVAEYEPARGAAIALAYGVDLAVLLQVLPGLKPTPAKKTAKTKTPVSKVSTA